MINCRLNIKCLTKAGNFIYNKINDFFQESYSSKNQLSENDNIAILSPNLSQYEWDLHQGLFDIFRKDILMICNRLIPTSLYITIMKLERQVLLYLLIDGTEEWSDSGKNDRQFSFPGHPEEGGNLILLHTTITHKILPGIIAFEDLMKNITIKLKMLFAAFILEQGSFLIHSLAFHSLEDYALIKYHKIRGFDRIKLKSSFPFHKRI
jgi:hypothetical protein